MMSTSTSPKRRFPPAAAFDWAAAAFFLDRCLLGSDLPRQVGDLLLV